MSNRVFWSERAKNDYKGILNYLHQNWSSKELAKFADKIEQNIIYLISNPEIGTVSKRNLSADLLFQGKHLSIIKSFMGIFILLRFSIIDKAPIS